MSDDNEVTLDQLVASQKKSNKSEGNNNKKFIKKTGRGNNNNNNRNNNNRNNNNNNNNRRGGPNRNNNNNNNNNNRRNNNNGGNRNNNRFQNNNNRGMNNNNNRPRQQQVIRRPAYQQQQPRTIVKAIPVYSEPKRAYDPFRDGVVMEIHNLYPKIQEEELYNLVTRYGAIEACRIERDDKGRSCEKATVVFKDKLSAEEAKKDLHRCELEGRTISVDIVNNDRSNSPAPILRDPMQRRNGFKSNSWQRNGFGARGRSGW